MKMLQDSLLELIRRTSAEIPDDVHRATLAALEKRGLPKSALELQMLYGMGDQLKAAAVELDLRLREYVPIGELIPGMAYLVRRLLENSSNESWLKAGFKDNASTERLLASRDRISAELAKVIVGQREVIDQIGRASCRERV